MRFSDQVVEALRTCHPDARKEIRRALDDLAKGIAQDAKPLERELVGFFRLRAGRFRVIYRLGQAQEVIAEYLAPRETVYGSFKPSKHSPTTGR